MTPDKDKAEKVARKFHDAYERLAPEFGYVTRAETRMFDPESLNGKLMIAVCSEIIDSNAKRIEELEAEVEALRNRPKYHHPDCNWWKWDWRYSWSDSDCNCDDVAGVTPPTDSDTQEPTP